MSTSGNRRPAAIYRRRRLAVVSVIALIAAVIVAVVVWQPWKAARPVANPSQTPGVSVPASAGPSGSRPVPPAPSATSSVSPAVTPTPTSSPTSPQPAPTPSASATLGACDSSTVDVVAVTDKTSYGAGEKPKLSITLTNKGDQACLMNVGTTTQVLTISSGNDTWWRSTDCQSKPSDQVVKINAGQTVSSVKPIEWDRTRSSVGTCKGTRPSAPAGYFQLTASIGGIDSTEARTFVLR